jgi:hypothetical protein
VYDALQIFIDQGLHALAIEIIDTERRPDRFRLVCSHRRAAPPFNFKPTSDIRIFYEQPFSTRSLIAGLLPRRCQFCQNVHRQWQSCAQNRRRDCSSSGCQNRSPHHARNVGQLREEVITCEISCRKLKARSMAGDDFKVQMELARQTTIRELFTDFQTWSLKFEFHTSTTIPGQPRRQEFKPATFWWKKKRRPWPSRARKAW